MRKLITTLVLCLSLSACASHYGAARIVSNPAGAEVINGKDGTSLGVTPTTVVWKDGSSNRQQLVLRFRKDGYHEKVSTFWLSMRQSSMKKARNSPDLIEVSLEKSD